jgi:hypothetical protein
MNMAEAMARPNSMRRIDLRRVAEFHAAGLDLQKTPPETQRLMRLVLNEAEALAAQTGLPELVLPLLAEEKVAGLRNWVARQESVRRRGLVRLLVPESKN